MESVLFPLNVLKWKREENANRKIKVDFKNFILQRCRKKTVEKNKLAHKGLVGTLIKSSSHLV